MTGFLLDPRTGFCQNRDTVRTLFIALLALSCSLVPGCKAKSSANKTGKATPPAQKNQAKDAAVRLPMPSKTAGAGFSLPETTRSAAARGVTVVERGKGKPIDLGLRFKAGDKQSLQLLLTARLGPVEGRSSMVYDVTVLKVDGKPPEQTATVELMFRELDVINKQDKVRTEAMMKMAADVVGQRLQATLNSSGQARVVKTDAKLAAVLDRLRLEPARLLGHMYPRFPPEKLGVGAKWLTQIKTTKGKLVETIDLTYELASAVKDKRGLVITVDLVGKLGVTSESTKGTGNLRGQIVLIPSRGIITKAALRQDVSLKVGQQAVTMSMLVDVIEKVGS